MKNIRIISRLDIKNQNVIKGIDFECLGTMGLASEIRINYHHNGFYGTVISRQGR
jgi:imidazole glycerol phosphate synthase subunit HisF